jgi:uncharacterized OsmC-like protein
VELIHVIARGDNVPLERVAVRIHGVVDRANQRRTDVTTFNSVRIDFTLAGVNQGQAAALVEGFKRRCPLYGTVRTAIEDVVVTFAVAG